MRDNRATWGFIIDVLDVLENHGYRHSDNLHTCQAVALIWDLARVYEGARDAPYGAAIQSPSPSQAETPPPAPTDEAAVVISGDEIKTVLRALDEASDYKRDHAATCSDCADQSCTTCQSRLQVAETYDHMMAQLLLTAEASRVANQPEPDTPTQPQAAADKEAGE